MGMGMLIFWKAFTCCMCVYVCKYNIWYTLITVYFYLFLVNTLIEYICGSSTPILLGECSFKRATVFNCNHPKGQSILEVCRLPGYCIDSIQPTNSQLTMCSVWVRAMNNLLYPLFVNLSLSLSMCHYNLDYCIWIVELFEIDVIHIYTIC